MRCSFGAYISFTRALDISEAENKAEEAAETAAASAASAHTATALVWEQRFRSDIGDVRNALETALPCRPFEQCGLFWLQYYGALIRLGQSFELYRKSRPGEQIPAGLDERACDLFLSAIPVTTDGPLLDTARLRFETVKELAGPECEPILQ